MSALTNSSFEIVDVPSRASGFDTPAFWDIIHYTAVKDHFEPKDLKDSEKNTFWWPEVKSDGLDAVSGNYFVLLSTGDLGWVTGNSILSQQINPAEGQSISFNYFFGTLDYIPYNDYASVRLISPTDPNDVIDLLIVGLDTETNDGYENYHQKIDVGRHGSTEGWQHFEYRFTEATASEYIFEVAVYDVLDTIYRSYIALDNINLCYAPEYGDINHDCFVDMTDFSLFAADWLCDCSDPDNLPDPNDCPWTLDRLGNVRTNFAGDINNDNAVNDTDLEMLTEQWLSGEKK
ncbi:MAG: hypothetical protein KAS23_06820 [Anaerohalosphaera sp.]|nr:hypothetical protein [Anaerohalosphaera sp.]